MERIRSVTVIVEVDTNKRTRRAILEDPSDEEIIETLHRFIEESSS